MPAPRGEGGRRYGTNESCCSGMHSKPTCDVNWRILTGNESVIFYGILTMDIEAHVAPNHGQTLEKSDWNTS